MLAPSDEVSFQVQVRETRTVAVSLAIALPVVEVQGDDYARAFAALTAERPAALLVGAHQYFVRDRKQIIELAAKYRLPAMYEWREQVLDGGLMSYGTNLHALYQRVAAQADRIFRGVKPGDLPVEQPTRFQLVINLKTAKALGLTLSPSLRLQTDELIE